MRPRHAEVSNVEITINDVRVEGWNPTGEWLNADGQKRVTIKSNDIKVDMVEDGLQREESFELKGVILQNNPF